MVMEHQISYTTSSFYCTIALNKFYHNGFRQEKFCWRKNANIFKIKTDY
jgi:hypothetical protein